MIRATIAVVLMTLSSPAAALDLTQASAANGAQIFDRKCSTCHDVTGQTVSGPPLNGVVGRKVASVEGFPYSDAMRGLDGAWTPALLDSYLVKPRRMLPGTAMSFGGLKKDTDRADLIAWLSGLRP
ncbi:cytochrome c family protein [Thioclava sp. A2]|uniref:cytochrome c family protein n=1 Tax=Thioclava sp. FCG-A2 TaxID=3080562 RepID=UPI002954D37E|nr:cytochrome c family protein [Thioclava sp. A2]MDV7270327.1 cytochrome c family protein [Thioclava sp. A2]